MRSERLYMICRACEGELHRVESPFGQPIAMCPKAPAGFVYGFANGHGPVADYVWVEEE